MPNRTYLMGNTQSLTAEAAYTKKKKDCWILREEKKSPKTKK